MSSTNSQESSPPPVTEMVNSSRTTLILPWIGGTVYVSSIDFYYNIGSILHGRTSVGGPQPASKALIESLPRVQVSDRGQECPICLVEYEVNSEVNQMPCRHVFHSDCLGKWLGIHGSCPVCRFSMPVEEQQEGEMDSTGLRAHVFVSRRSDGDMDSESGNGDYGDSQSQAQKIEEID